MARQVVGSGFSLEGLNEGFARLQSKWSFGGKARADMYDDLASFMEAGLPPYEALQGILDVYQLKRHPLEYMVRQWVDALHQGKTLAQALDGWCPPAEISMVASGERSGKLAAALREAANLTRGIREIMSEARTKLVMPIIQLGALFALVLYLSYTVVPAAKKLLPEQYMSSLVKGYFAFGEFVIAWGAWIVLGVVVALGVIFWTFPKWSSSLRYKLDGMLPWSLYRMLQSAALLVTLSAMTRAGVPMAQALQEVHKFSSPWLEHYLDEMMMRLRKGRRESVALDVGLLPDDMAARLMIYSRLPNFSDVMDQLGRDAIVRTKQTVSALASRINVSVMLLTAVFIMATIFSLGDVSFTISDVVEKRSKGI